MSQNLLENQSAQRTEFLNSILESNARFKIIVAGPGTGKTHTLGKLLRYSDEGPKLALTFIRKLVADMHTEFGDLAEVKTFHAFCKKLLHERYGGIEFAPYLNSVVIEDSEAFNHPTRNFRRPFQMLDEESWELNFFLQRGDYYHAVAFDDSVYRVYRDSRNQQLDIPVYEQIVIDEYQDFNPLEVAFLNLLQELSPILIVGDDDQAVYRLRNSSPQHLREKYYSGDFEVFELPFCSRCPRCVVDSVVHFINSAIDIGGFEGRVPRPFVPFLEGKEELNHRYPKIITAQTSNIACLKNFVNQSIQNIPPEETEEAYQDSYPCVLIVGQKQYLNPIYKFLSQRFPDVKFTQGSEPEYSIIDGYKLLLSNDDSNLGWRLLAGSEIAKPQLYEIIVASEDGSSFRSLLTGNFIDKHLRVLVELRKENISEVDQEYLTNELGEDYQVIIEHFFSQGSDEEPEPDITQPSILLSSFEGCKGLSAGHVFIVGMNEGEMPKVSNNGIIEDIEFSKFIVALTRARKLSYVLSNRWQYKPIPPRLIPSQFVSMIPDEGKIDYGYVLSDGIAGIVSDIFD